MSVQEEFNKVAARVRDAKPNDAIPLEEKLKVYALYKQVSLNYSFYVDFSHNYHHNSLQRLMKG